MNFISTVLYKHAPHSFTQALPRLPLHNPSSLHPLRLPPSSTSTASSKLANDSRKTFTQHVDDIHGHGHGHELVPPLRSSILRASPPSLSPPSTKLTSHPRNRERTAQRTARGPTDAPPTSSTPAPTPPAQQASAPSSPHAAPAAPLPCLLELKQPPSQSPSTESTTTRASTAGHAQSQNTHPPPSPTPPQAHPSARPAQTSRSPDRKSPSPRSAPRRGRGRSREERSRR